MRLVIGLHSVALILLCSIQEKIITLQKTKEKYKIFTCVNINTLIYI